MRRAFFFFFFFVKSRCAAFFIDCWLVCAVSRLYSGRNADHPPFNNTNGTRNFSLIVIAPKLIFVFFAMFYLLPPGQRVFTATGLRSGLRKKKKVVKSDTICQWKRPLVLKKNDTVVQFFLGGFSGPAATGLWTDLIHSHRKKKKKKNSGWRLSILFFFSGEMGRPSKIWLVATSVVWVASAKWQPMAA